MSIFSLCYMNIWRGWLKVLDNAYIIFHCKASGLNKWVIHNMSILFMSKMDAINSNRAPQVAANRSWQQNEALNCNILIWNSHTNYFSHFDEFLSADFFFKTLPWISDIFFHSLLVWWLKIQSNHLNLTRIKNYSTPYFSKIK